MNRTLPVLIAAAALVLCPARAEAPAPVVAGEVGAKLDRFLTESDFVGAALVAKGGTVVLMKGYGLADREHQVPWGTDTLISIGSITKQFTAAAILKLESEGKLSVDDTLVKFFPDAPEDKRAITIHQLLTHTAGLESDFAGDYEPVGRDEYVQRILRSKLHSKPGAEHEYANSGYSLLAAIVEIVSGQGYEAYLRERLFLPAGMKETGYRIPKWDARRVPVGYRDGKRWGTMLEKPWAPDGPYWALRGNGGIESTLSDLYAWSRALDGNDVLPASARKKLFTPYVPEGPGADSFYAYGWAIFTTPWGTKLVAHDGGNGVFSADFRRYVDDGIVVIAASNLAGVKTGRLTGPVGRIAHGDVVAAESPQPQTLKPLADGPRTAQIKRFVAAFNTHDLAAVRAFRAEAMVKRPNGPTDDERDRVTQRMWDEFGTLTIDGMLNQDEEGVGTRMTDAKGHKVRVRFLFAPDGKIAGLMIEPED